MSTSLRRWAIKYARSGFRVLPLEPGGKSPLGSSKDSPYHSDARRPVHGCDDATTSTKQINLWWKLWPDANIGISPPSGIAIVDIDPRNGGKRLRTMAPTFESKSGRGDGGGHHFYKSPPEHLPGELAPGIDLITGNRYVVAPPSIHPDSGLPYEWVGTFDPARIQPWPEGLVPHADKPLTPKLNGAHLPLSPSQVAWCLERISASERDDWWKVGMGIKEDYGEGGFDWWVTWSATTTKRDAKGELNFKGETDCRKTWDSFHKEGKTTRTLKFMAESASGEAMPKPDPREEFPDPRNELDEIDILDTTPSAGKKKRAPKDPDNPILTLDALRRQHGPKWRIKNVLPETGTALIFGASQSGKTFLTLDLVAAIVGKREWGGEKRRVRNGKVVYVAAEGAGGFRNRVEALVQNHNDLNNLYTLPVSLQISQEKAVERLIRWIREAVSDDDIGAIVFDTLSQVMAGIDENQSMMGIALKAADRLRAEFNCLVIFIGHSGKDPAKGHRGWSGVFAAVDTAIEVVESNSIRTATIRKQRDGESGVEYSFVLRPVTIGIDEDGDPITTCVLDYCDTPVAAPRRPDGSIQTTVYEVIKTGICEVKDVIAESIKAIRPPSEGKDRRREYAKRALAVLVANQVVIQEGTVVRLPV